MNDKLFIPTKCKVGFNPRPDTYSGKLAYVIAQDGKKWRKEPSWLGWIYNYMSPEEYEQKRRADYESRKASVTNNFNIMKTQIDDHYSGKNKLSEYSLKYNEEVIENGLDAYLVKNRVEPYNEYTAYLGRIISDESFIPYEFDNVPTSGFVLNKRVGGYSSGWNHRQTYARVYDPRGFEFEISMENLLFILQECNSVKGKALEGEFVYSWSGKDLILLPTSSSDYSDSKKFNEVQKGKISVKDLIVGHEYLHKSNEHVVYLGRLNYCDTTNYYGEVGVGHVFYNTKSTKFHLGEAVSSISSKTSDGIVDNFGDILIDFDNKHKFTNLKHDLIDYKDALPLQSYLGRANKPTNFLRNMKINENEILSVIVSLTLSENRGYSRWSNRAVTEYHIKSSKRLVFENGGITISKDEKFNKVIKPNEINTIDFVKVQISNNNSKLKDLKIK